MTAYSLRRLHFDVLEAKTSGTSLIGEPSWFASVAFAYDDMFVVPMEHLCAKCVDVSSLFYVVMSLR